MFAGTTPLANNSGLFSGLQQRAASHLFDGRQVVCEHDGPREPARNRQVGQQPFVPGHESTERLQTALGVRQSRPEHALCKSENVERDHYHGDCAAPNKNRVPKYGAYSRNAGNSMAFTMAPVRAAVAIHTNALVALLESSETSSLEAELCVSVAGTLVYSTQPQPSNHKE